jgi:predicted TIM-barrel fold metal-dependent hydrolase
MFFNIFNRPHSRELCDAGMRAHHRWLADTFGHATDRLFLVGVGTTGTDIDATVAELDWIADHGFAGTYAPGFTAQPQLPPLWDDYWEPVWQRCVERGLPLFVHAGHGLPQGVVLPDVERIKAEVAQAGGSEADFIGRVAGEVLTGEFFSDVRPRQPMWQLMLGGVFDRHPNLRLMMTEVRGDWLPAALDRLDAAFDEHRDALPASRKPSEYWHSNCMAGLSFMHRSEIDRRHDIGVDTISFGRDYPHTEGTWPNTTPYLQALFEGVPEDEVRQMLGENLTRFLGLDRTKLAAINERIGLAPADVLVERADLDPALVAHLNARCGFAKPFEGDLRLAQMEPLLTDDLARVTAR